jgi:hypothetical protein
MSGGKTFILTTGLLILASWVAPARAQMTNGLPGQFNPLNPLSSAPPLQPAISPGPMSAAQPAPAGSSEPSAQQCSNIVSAAQSDPAIKAWPVYGYCIGQRQP